MHKTQPVSIIGIIGKTIQGKSDPYLCVGENNAEYIVKGLGSRRHSQISEWICANLALRLGLPIPDFTLVDIPEELYEELEGTSFKSIGSGIAFGSKKIEAPNWFEGRSLGLVDEELQRKILVFDLWIKNMDRTRINPNLLYQAESGSLIIIDHNLAFDQDFALRRFLETHLFADRFAEVAYNLVKRMEMEDWLQSALVALDEICDNLPSEWEWLNLECDIPTNYDFEFMRQALGRCAVRGALWEDK